MNMTSALSNASETTQTYFRKRALLSVAIAVCVSLPAAADGHAPPSAEEMWKIIKEQQKQIAELQVLLKSKMSPDEKAHKKHAGERMVKKDPDALTVNVGGFVRADYGTGSRYTRDTGRDVLGVSRAALATVAKYKNTSATLVLGTGDLTGSGGGDFNGNTFVADAFFNWDNIGGSKFSLTGGLRPILFGLKPNGFPADHSLQGSIEYGAGGAFAVSNQAGASIIGMVELAKGVSLEAGFFDFDAAALVPDEGSSFTENYFIQIKVKNLGGTGFYGFLGYEGRYVGTLNDTRPIFDIGVGYDTGKFDVSLEYISLDGGITGTAADESYLIAEFQFRPNDKTTVYFDYATADQLNLDTYRIGIGYNINKHFTFNIEYSLDDFSAAANASSVDARLTFGF